MSSVFLEETEVLKSIYFEDITLGESYVEYKSECRVLKLLVPDTYPNQAPEVVIKGILDVQADLANFSKTLIGNPMIYDIIEKYKILVELQQASNIKTTDATETIDMRSFLNETSFSKESFLKWVDKVQASLVDETSRNLDRETGKVLFSRLKDHCDYDSLIKESNE